MDSSLLKRAAPAVFVLLWSTGFIVAKYGTRDAGPLTFLTIRSLISALALFVVAHLVRETRIPRERIPVQIVVGTGMHAMYLGGVWVAIHHGLPSGISALIAALHPVLTTILGIVFLHESLTARRGWGALLGCAGVIAVVADRGGGGDGVSTFALVAMVIAVGGMSLGTLVQRRFATGTPLLFGTAWQYLATTAVLGVCAISSEGWQFSVTTQSAFALAWSVIVLSLSAILIMLWLLRRQAASQVSSLFFLTPALSTVQGAVLFREKVGPLALMGLAVAAVGVWLATSET